MRLPAALVLLAVLLAAPSAAADPPSAAAEPTPRAYAPYARSGDDELTYRDPPVTERRSPRMVITGAALWFAGALVAVPGAGVLVAQALGTCQIVAFGGSPPPDRPSLGRIPRITRAPAGGGERLGTAQQAFDIPCGSNVTAVPLGVGLLLGGLVVGATGIPLVVIGNQSVPARPRGDDARLPALHVGAGTVDLRWSF